MKLVVQMDEQVLRKYYSRNAPPLMSIFWQHNDWNYPDDRWSDFGVVIIGWWIMALKALFDGSTEQELLFMDGPYSLKVVRNGDIVSVYPKGIQEGWSGTLQPLAQELMEASIQIRNYLREINLGANDAMALSEGIHLLQSSRSSVEH